ncbi:MAG TPA: DEAD/DEAH box helicase [Bacteroidales bacterium]|nr:DEAD/DEAH box helicase [Bacteroidales bacterium]
MKFKDFNFHDSVEEGLESIGFDVPTPVQEKAIPVILNNLDLIACAQTGTGKTAAYILPLLHKLVMNGSAEGTQSLIIVPTRELALQIDQQFQGFSYFVPVSTVTVYGGNTPGDWDQQKRALTSGAEIVIATPGRLISHINLGYVNLKTVRYLILDEADRMLDMGFHDDLMRIVKETPENRQTLLFSATMPTKIRQLANKILNKPEYINISVSKPAEGVLQAAYVMNEKYKLPLIIDLLKDKSEESAVIFSATKSNVKSVARELKKLGLKAEAIHSDLEQSEREQVLLGFKNKKFQILVATDIISRGIDIVGIDLVLNYDVPHEPEDYIHRVGRTARAENTGVAITFVSGKDKRKFDKIEKFLGQPVHKLNVPPHIFS